MSVQVFERIVSLLENNNIDFSLTVHEPVFTSKEAAIARGGLHRLRFGAKAMILKVDDFFVQCVIPADKMVDLERVKKLFGAERVRLAKPREVVDLTGCAPGSIPPFGNLFGFEVVADPLLSDRIDFSPGVHDKSISMEKKDWLRLVRPRVERVSAS